jgi:hypothetical protein
VLIFITRPNAREIIGMVVGIALFIGLNYVYAFIASKTINYFFISENSLQLMAIPHVMDSLHYDISSDGQFYSHIYHLSRPCLN